jgi:hypothetical protein
MYRAAAVNYEAGGSKRRNYTTNRECSVLSADRQAIARIGLFQLCASSPGANFIHTRVLPCENNTSNIVYAFFNKSLVWESLPDLNDDLDHYSTIDGDYNVDYRWHKKSTDIYCLTVMIC